jgi:hypothetical protein
VNDELTALEEDTANELDPSNDPVNELAMTVFNTASEPDVINFFQFGISIYYGWLSGLPDPLLV